MPGTRSRRTLPVPARPRLYLLLPALVAGVVGTSLLYNGGVSANLGDLAAGVPLFGLGLWGAGWPFVQAMALTKAAGQRRRRLAAGRHQPGPSGPGGV